jgi:small subunit ribosomal protein S1
MTQREHDDIEYIEDVKPEEIYKYCDSNRPGDTVDGRVLQVTPDGVYVDIGAKSDGFAPAEEFMFPETARALKPGDVIKVSIQRVDPTGTCIVSPRKARENEMLPWLQKAQAEQTTVEAKIMSVLDYGATADVGIDALIPFREMTRECKARIREYVGQTISVLVKELRTGRGHSEVILSQKDLAARERQQQREKVLAGVNEGDVVIGTVKTVTGFGAFVDIGGMDALLHVSDMAWYRVEKPADVLNIGDKIKVKVLKVDAENAKISVGLKQLFPHPWDSVETRFKTGEVVSAKVTSVTKFGLFVELEPGVEGLVHLSEISWKGTPTEAPKQFKPGQEVRVKVLEINREQRRISLSLKKAQHNPWTDLKAKYPAGTKITGTISRVAPFGLFVTIEPGFDGLVHLSDLSWSREPRSLKEFGTQGDPIECMVTEISPDEERASLSVKHLKPNPYEKYRSGTVVHGKVLRVLRSAIIVELEPGVEGMVRKKDLAGEDRDSDAGDRALASYSVGQEVDAVVVSSNEKTHTIELSVRKLEREVQRQLIRKYASVERMSLRDLLEEK